MFPFVGIIRIKFRGYDLSLPLPEGSRQTPRVIRVPDRAAKSVCPAAKLTKNLICRKKNPDFFTALIHSRI